jgi:TonB-dependent starch-binding outer membrane protein SusC
MKKGFLLAFLVVVTLFSALAQSRKITGCVTSFDDGLPIPGVTVGVKGATTGTITDVKGNYLLAVPESAKELYFSFVGMITQLPSQIKLMWY